MKWDYKWNEVIDYWALQKDGRKPIYLNTENEAKFLKDALNERDEMREALDKIRDDLK